MSLTDIYTRHLNTVWTYKARFISKEMTTSFSTINTQFRHYGEHFTTLMGAYKPLERKHTLSKKDFVRPGVLGWTDVASITFSYRKYRVREQFLCTCARSVLHCADSGKVPYIKHFNWHIWPLSHVRWSHVQDLTVTATTVHPLRLPIYPTSERYTSTGRPPCIHLRTQKDTSTHAGDPFMGQQFVKTHGSRPNLHSDEHPEYYTVLHSNLWLLFGRCNLPQDTKKPLIKFLRCSTQTLQANRGTVPESRPQSPSSTSFIIHYPLWSNHSMLGSQRPWILQVFNYAIDG